MLVGHEGVWNKDNIPVSIPAGWSSVTKFWPMVCNEKGMPASGKFSKRP